MIYYVLYIYIFCDYSDAYILVKGTIAVQNTGTAPAPNNRNKKVIFRKLTSID